MPPLENHERSEIHRVEEAVAREVSQFRQQLSSLDQAEQAELAQLAAEARDLHLRMWLRDSALSAASLSGIGPKIKDRLRAHGVSCAADIDHRIYRVSGIGPSKAGALMAWRREVERQAAATAPDPSAAEELAVRRRYEPPRHHLLSQIHATQSSESRRRQTVMDNFARLRQQLDRKEQEAKWEYDHNAELIRREYEARKATLADRFRQAKDTTDAKRSELDEQIIRLEQSLFGRQFELCKTQREADRYQHVSFLSFLMQIIRVHA